MTPRVLVVHGINNTFSGPAQMTDSWLPALTDGMTLAGGDKLLGSGDVGSVFFGDLFRPPGRFLGDDGMALTADDVCEGPELDLLIAWWESASRIDPTVVAPAAKTLGARSTARAAVLALSGSKFLARVSEAVLVLWIKQVTAYFTDSSVRAAVQARFSKALEPNTQVVVAHSLGSVVAYEGLCVAGNRSVTDFITLGSPLGIRHVVFDRLKPKPVHQADGSWLGAWPLVERWINIVDEADFVAVQPRLRDLFGDRVVDVAVDNGLRAHKFERYLSAAETGAAMLAGLRSDATG